LNFNFINIVISGYYAIINNEGSSSTRLHDYKVATELFLETPYWGLGFESPHVSMMHNLQLQLFYEYGIVPFTVIVIIIAIFITIVRNKTYKSKFMYSLKSNEIYCKYFKLIFWVLFIHVFLFGLTNHNQTHFLTWLFFGHLLLKIKCKYNVGVFYEKTKIGNRF
jgi:O-antigen ligase